MYDSQKRGIDLGKSFAKYSSNRRRIIIVDTGSTDKTILIASKFTNKIKHFKWIDDFSAARNFADSMASMEYICRWDADWILQETSLEKILDLKNRDFEKADLANFRWNLEFNDDLVPIQAEPYYFIYKRDNFVWRSPIHNYLAPKNPDQEIITFTDDSIQIDHFKDPEVKAGRYRQTSHIIEQALAEKNPEYPRLLYFQIQGLMFEKEFELALQQIGKFKKFPQAQETIDSGWLVEQEALALLQLGKIQEAWDLIQSMSETLREVPKFNLIRADVATLVDPYGAIEFYEKYLGLQKNHLPGHFNIEREEVHPRLMLAHLLSELGNTGDQIKAAALIQEVIQLSRLPETENQAKMLLTKIEDKNKYENKKPDQRQADLD